MFALVKFTDGVQSIYPMKKIKVLSKTTCVVKYSGANYEAQLLASNDTREKLQALQSSSEEPSSLETKVTNTVSKKTDGRTSTVGNADQSYASTRTRATGRKRKSSVATQKQSSYGKPQPTKVKQFSSIKHTTVTKAETRNKMNEHATEEPRPLDEAIADVTHAVIEGTFEMTNTVDSEDGDYVPASTQETNSTDKLSADVELKQSSQETQETNSTDKLSADVELKQSSYAKPRIIKVVRFSSMKSFIASKAETVPQNIVASSSNPRLRLDNNISEEHSSLEGTIDQSDTDGSRGEVAGEVNGDGTYVLASPGQADCDLAKSSIRTVFGTSAADNNTDLKENVPIIDYDTPVIFDYLQSNEGDTFTVVDNTNRPISQVLTPKQSDESILDINSSIYMFDSLVHDPNTLFPSIPLLSSTPENFKMDEHANFNESNDTAMETESAVKEPPCSTALDEDELSDNDRHDPEYQPQAEDVSDSGSDVESAVDGTEDRSQNSAHNSSNVTSGLNVSTAKTLPGSNRCNDEDLFVEISRGRKGDKKFNFCLYCHKKQKKIARHLEDKHGDEPDVKKFTELPKNTIERRNIIGIIRKKGNFLFNSQTEHNDGELIVARRPNMKFNRTANDFRACANCKAYFSINSLRMHFAKCTGRSSKTNRIVTVMSKQVMARMHSRATKIVIEQIFPALREDQVVRAIRYDELVIVYANKMGEKYTEARDYEMVRQRIRLLGRFLITVRKLDAEITDMASVFDPKFCDVAVLAITIEAKLTPALRQNATPTVATSLGTLLKLLGSILINECIKKHDDAKKKFTKDFLKLLTQELALSLNRRVAETQTQQKRKTKVELPSMADVKKLCTYLELQRNAAFHELKENFSERAWIKLAETTLTSTQLFNRRRAGEIERTTIEDFKNYQSLDANTDKDIFNGLSKESQAVAKRYVRFVISVRKEVYESYT